MNKHSAPNLLGKITPSAGSLLMAFTLMEMMVVIAIILILIGMATPPILIYKKQAREARASTDVNTIGVAASVYHVHTGRWPQVASNGSGLVTDDGQAGWKGPYLNSWKKDPWGSNYTIWDEDEGSSSARYAVSRGANKTIDSCAAESDDICYKFTTEDEL